MFRFLRFYVLANNAWTHEEVAILLDTAHEREPFVYPVLLAAFSTGMRRSELLAFRWEHIQPDGIRVRDSFVRGVTKTPKSDRARTVPMSPEMHGSGRRRVERPWGFLATALVRTPKCKSGWTSRDATNFAFCARRGGRPQSNLHTSPARSRKLRRHKEKFDDRSETL